MENNTILEIKTEKQHLFLQNGFFNPIIPTKTLHFHGYTEIHIFVGGTMKYIIDGKAYTFSSGDILAIPKKTYHHCIDVDNSKSIAFQIENELQELMTAYLSPTLVAEFAKEIKKAEKTSS